MRFGAIPIRWIEAASRLPGKSLHAGLAIWATAELTRSLSVPFDNLIGQRFSLDRNSKYRALFWLEKAGLIAVRRRVGSAPLVTILQAENDGEGPS